MKVIVTRTIRFLLCFIGLLATGGTRPAGSACTEPPFGGNTSALDGFDSQFNGSAEGWEAHSGVWTVTEQCFRSEGLDGQCASVSHAVQFADLDYQVRMRRQGMGSNRLYVRGVPEPLWGDSAK